MREILTVVTGPLVLLAEELGRIDGIESAFLYGCFATRLRGVDGPSPHDIDVMVVGTPDVDAVYEACTRVAAAVDRPVNPTIPSAQELRAESGFLGHGALRCDGPGDGGVAVAIPALTRVQQATVLAFEAIHESTYRELGFDLVEVAPDTVERWVKAVESLLDGCTNRRWWRRAGELSTAPAAHGE